VFSGKFCIQTRHCQLNYEYQIEPRQWYHICVVVNATITSFINGELVTPDNTCLFNDSQLITSDSSVMTLGCNPFVKNFIDGDLADVRIYPVSINNSQVDGIRNFIDSDENYVSVISNELTTRSLPPGITKKKMIASELIKQIPSMWLYVPEKLSYNATVGTCERFGGRLLQLADIPDQFYLVNYVVNILEIFSIETWVLSDNLCIYMSVSPFNVYTKKMNCDARFNFICDIPSHTVYTVIGVPRGKIEMSLIPLDFSFSDGMITDLKYKNNMMKFVNSFNGKEMMCIDDFITPSTILMRRHNWKSLASPSDPPMSLVITTCNETQFTCDDGQCVNIFLVCDNFENCFDSSDEFYCNSTELRPVFYDRDQSGSNPSLVGVKFSLQKITDVDLENNVLRVIMRMDVRWKDPRPVFHNLHPRNPKYISEADSSYYWQPDVKIKGAVQAHKDQFSFLLNPGGIILSVEETGSPSHFASHEGKELVKMFSLENRQLQDKLIFFNYSFIA